MRLAGLYIKKYGVLSDFGIEGHLDGVPTVIYGLNETGKSTLISFIRGVLFGFKTEGNKRYPVQGGQPAGWLILKDTGGEEYRVSRSGNGRASVDLPDGNKEGESFLNSYILNGIGPVLFRNVFAVGMDELRKLEDLKKEEVSARIYGAGTGVSPENLARAVEYLHDSSKKLFNPKGYKQEINLLLKEIKSLDSRIRDLETMPARYAQLQKELEIEEKEKQDMSREYDKLQARKSRLEILLKAREPWLRRQNLLNRLAELDAVDDFPADGISRLDTLNERKNNKEETVKRCDDYLDNLQEQLENININHNAGEHLPLVKQLSGEKTLFIEKRQKISEEEARIIQLREEVKEHLANLGTGWDENKVLALDLSYALYSTVEDYEERLQELRRSREQASRERTHLQEEVEKCGESIEQIKSQLDGSENIEELVAALEDLYIHLQEGSTLKVAMDRERNRYNDLRSRYRVTQENLGSYNNYKRPRWIPVVIAALGMGGLVFTGLSAGGILTAAGSIIIAVFIHKNFTRQAAEDARRREQLEQEKENLEQELESINSGIRDMESRLAGIEQQGQESARLLGLSYGDVDLNMLSGIRRRLESEREKQSRIKQYEDWKQSAQKALEKAREKEKHYNDELQGVWNEWENWCRDNSLPVLKPRDMESFFKIAEKARESIKKLQPAERGYQETIEYVDGFVRRVNKAAAALGLTSAGRENAVDRVAALEKIMEDYANAAERKNELEKRKGELEEERKSAARELEDVKKRIEELFQTAGVSGEEDFRSRAAVYQKREKFKEDIENIKEQLLTIAGSHEELESIEEELASSSREEHHAELKRLQARLEEISSRLEELGNSIAEKNVQVRDMENSEELSRARQEREMLVEQLAHKSRQWKVRVLCSSLLDMARKKHERERQPTVLQQASSFFSCMTGGRYTRVISPIGAPEQLEVERPDKDRVSSVNLSRGAANQLYLALRLALARHYGTVSLHLPVILDDVMVDFDPPRLGGAAEVLRDMAQEHQVLLFTCHRHILETVRDKLPGYKCIDLEK